MNVLLLTPFDTGNVGTIMQAYATFSLIQELGHDVKIAYYHYDSIQNPFLISNLFKRGLKRYIGSVAGFLMRYPAKKKLWDFIRSHVDITEKIAKAGLEQLSKDYDFLIVGSDCVWNGEAFQLETAYLLDFVGDNHKKGNFASSFACDNIGDDLRPIFTKYLSQFPMLSVREVRGQQLIRELTGKDSTVVLDPTLVRDSSFWNKIADESKLKFSGEYIFVAEYAISAALMKDAEKLSRKYNLPVYCLYPPKGKIIKSKLFLKSGPEDVMQLIRNAKYVFTDSYHMMIFSINFNKEFFAYKTPTNIPAISKYESILGWLDLNERLFDTQDKNENEIDITTCTPINYGRVNKRLEEKRNKSIDYLKNLLQNAEKHFK